MRVQTKINHISICFFTTTSTPKNFFFQSASCKRHSATHSPMVLDRLVRSEHAHASYPGLSFHPDVKVSNTRVQTLHGTGRKESSGTGLNKTTKSVIPRKCIIIHQTHYEKSDWSRAFNQFTIACELDMINAISAAAKKFDVLKTGISSLEASLLGQILVLRTSHFRGATISRQFSTETLYCLIRVQWVSVIISSSQNFGGALRCKWIIKFLRRLKESH